MLLAQHVDKQIDKDTQTWQATSCSPALMHPLCPTLAATYVVIQPASQELRSGMTIRKKA